METDRQSDRVSAKWHVASDVQELKYKLFNAAFSTPGEDDGWQVNDSVGSTCRHGNEILV